MLSRISKSKRIGVITGFVLLVLVAASGIYVLIFFQRDVPEVHSDIKEHFKYGSIVTEAGAGVP